MRYNRIFAIVSHFLNFLKSIKKDKNSDNLR